MNRYICQDFYNLEHRKSFLIWVEKIQKVFQEGNDFYHFSPFLDLKGQEIIGIRIEKPDGRIMNPICHRGLDHFRIAIHQGVKLNIKNILTGKIQKCRLPEKYCFSNGSWPRNEDFHYRFGYD